MPLTRLTLRQVEAFFAVAELESALSLRLFDRTTRRATLSSAGRDFLPSAQTLQRHVHADESVADDVRHRAAGVARVGPPLVLAGTVVPAASRGACT